MRDTRWPAETREMRLISRVIELTDDVPDTSLPGFIARRRTPGPDWTTWDELSFDLAKVLDEIVTDGTLRQWATRYGIPEGTKADGTGPVSEKAFKQALAKAGVKVATK